MRPSDNCGLYEGFALTIRKFCVDLEEPVEPCEYKIERVSYILGHCCLDGEEAPSHQSLSRFIRLRKTYVL
jgi:hypothetical protein